MARKKLLRRPDKRTTYEEFLSKIKTYTDKDAQKLGYPTVELFRLEISLEQLVISWHQTNEDTFIVQYHKILYTMILKGYDLDRLPLEAQLPILLMPEYPSMKVRTAILDEYKKIWSKVDN